MEQLPQTPQPNKTSEFIKQLTDISKLALDKNFELQPEDIYKLAEIYKPSAKKEGLDQKTTLKLRDFGDYLVQFPEIKDEKADQDLKEQAAKRVALLMRLDYYMSRHEHQSFELEQEGGKLEHKLRDYQYKILENFYEFLFDKNRTGYVAIPTGVGKTTIFSEIIESLNLKTLVVAPTKPLIEQTEEKLNQFVPDAETEKIYSDSKESDLKGKEADISVITYKSLAIKIEDKSLNINDYDLVVYDEAHHGLGKVNYNIIKKILNDNPDAINIGFTASPKPRLDQEKHIGQLFSKPISTMNVNTAIEKGYLCKPKKVFKELNIGDHEIIDPETTDMIIDHYMTLREEIRKDRKPDHNPKFIAYCEGKEHAKAFAEAMTAKGIKTKAIDDKTPQKVRQEIFRQLKTGDIDGIANVDVLTEGFDEDSVEIDLNISPSNSTKVAEQRAGRALRLEQEDKTAYIVDYKYIEINKPDQVFFKDIINRPDDSTIKKPEKGWVNYNTLTNIIEDIVNNKTTDIAEIMAIIGENNLADNDVNYNHIKKLAEGISNINTDELSALLYPAKDKNINDIHLKEVIDSIMADKQGLKIPPKKRYEYIRLCQEPKTNKQEDSIIEEQKNSLYFSPKIFNNLAEKFNNIKPGKFAPREWQRLDNFPELILGINRKDFLVKVFGKVNKNNNNLKKFRPSVFINTTDDYAAPTVSKLVELVTTSLKNEAPKGYKKMDDLMAEILAFAPTLENSVYQHIFLSLIDQKESHKIAYVEKDTGKKKKEIEVYLSKQLYQDVYEEYSKYKPQPAA